MSYSSSLFKRERGGGGYDNHHISRHHHQHSSSSSSGRYVPGTHPERQKPRKAASKEEFSDALEQLSLSLKESSEFFTRFEKSFADDIRMIKLYAPSEIIDALWVSKAAASDKPKPKSRGRYNLDSNNDNVTYLNDTNTPEGSFREYLGRVKDTFETTLGSAPTGDQCRERSSKGEAESVVRLVHKLTVQFEAFLGLVAKIYRIRSYVKEFSKESELVLEYLERSMELWKVTGRRQVTEKEHYEEEEEHEEPEKKEEQQEGDRRKPIFID